MTQTDHAAAREREHWALDKKVPLAVIVTIIIQTVAAIWWVATMDSRMAGVEARLIEIQSQRLDVRVTSMEDQNRALHVQLNRIELKLDRVIEREGGRTTHD